MGFEPTTPSLGSWYSTTELRPHSSLVENKDKELYLSKLYHVKHYCSRTIRFKVLIFAVTQGMMAYILSLDMNCDVLIHS